MRTYAWTARCMCALAAAALLAIPAGKPANAADHADSPSVAGGDPALDITDLYAWVEGTNLVVAVAVNPLSGPVATDDFHFSTTGEYWIHIDADGDVATDEMAILLQFADKGEDQWVRVRGTGHGEGANDEIIGRVNSPHDGAAAAPRIVSSDDGAVRVFAGPRDDAFFFSLTGNNGDHLGFTTCDAPAEECFLGWCDRNPSSPGYGCLNDFTPYPTDAVDTFAGLNVSAIVIELPLADFASSNLGVWASTKQ